MQSVTKPIIDWVENKTVQIMSVSVLQLWKKEWLDLVMLKLLFS